MALRIVEPIARAEDDLVAACVRGDRAAERELFRREYPRVLRLVYRLVGSTRDLDDILQETFIGVFRGLPGFRGESRLATWIDRIAVRAVFNHFSTRRRQPVPVEVVMDQVDAAGDLGDRAQAREGLRRLYAVLAKLSIDARIAFALYAIDGRSVAEVAAITRTAQVTAKVRIWRARRELERRIAGDAVLRDYVARRSAR
ncbi:MAG TPA: RNA polymerase sigma factor [Kofleriaceae bacterium]|nr:RNA polymerase sigma factor [Kofleriaceae bacterium]